MEGYGWYMPDSPAVQDLYSYSYRRDQMSGDSVSVTVRGVPVPGSQSQYVPTGFQPTKSEDE